MNQKEIEKNIKSYSKYYKSLLSNEGIKSELAEKYGVGKSDEIWKYANFEYHKLEQSERTRNPGSGADDLLYG